MRFLLTGTSARKRKRGAANLLAGRAHMAQLFPFSWHEIAGKVNFDLPRVLRYGTMPLAYLSDEPEEYLHAYVETYHKEEIQAEALTRSLPNYARFLRAAALNGGKIINHTKAGSDAQLSPSTVRDYYQILTDTLLGFELEAWQTSKKAKPFRQPSTISLI